MFIHKAIYEYFEKKLYYDYHYTDTDSIFKT